MFFGLPHWACGKESLFVLMPARLPLPEYKGGFLVRDGTACVSFYSTESFQRRTLLRAGWHKQATSLYSDKGERDQPLEAAHKSVLPRISVCFLGTQAKSRWEKFSSRII